MSLRKLVGRLAKVGRRAGLAYLTGGASEALNPDGLLQSALVGGGGGSPPPQQIRSVPSRLPAPTYSRPAPFAGGAVPWYVWAGGGLAVLLGAVLIIKK